MGKILPLLMLLIGAGAGVGAGLFLRPAAEEHGALPAEEMHDGEAAHEAPPDYVKLNNQFVVPVVEGGRVASMVVMSLSLEITSGQSDQVYAREPKIRDVLLQVLFDHANSGGFRGSFTDGSNLVMLRQALREAAVGVLGPICTDVLIIEIARQDS